MYEIEHNKISDIKITFNALKRLNEENTKILVVLEILKILGYDSSTFDFEHPVYHQKQRADIVIQITDKNFLYVETKRGDIELSEKDIIQLANYLNTRSIEWGLLTNGKELILVNNKIITSTFDEASLENKIVFKINLITNAEIKYLKFLSKEALFDTKVTNYFKDIAQFRAYKYPKGQKSYTVYKGTLYNFFTYYAEKENKYRPLEQIRIDDFEDFLAYEQNKKSNTKNAIKAQDTIKNKYSHIRSMLTELKKHKYISSHHFEEERDKLISKLEYQENNKDTTILNAENVALILSFLNCSENSIRDTTIFSLCIYMGLERSALIDLNKKMFNLEKSEFKIGNRIIPLPTKITFLVSELIRDNTKKGIKGSHLFYTYYLKKYNVMTENSINKVFERIKNIDLSNEKWTVFSPQYIRSCLIKLLFENNYTIEDISYLTGMDLTNISKHITFEEICNKVNLSNNNPKLAKHPFAKFLNS